MLYLQFNFENQAIKAFNHDSLTFFSKPKLMLKSAEIAKSVKTKEIGESVMKNLIFKGHACRGGHQGGRSLTVKMLRRCVSVRRRILLEGNSKSEMYC